MVRIVKRTLTTAYEIASREVITASPYDSLASIRSLMIKNNIGRVVISEDEKPIGIITKKDIVKFLSIDDSNRSILEIPASEVMNPNLVLVKPSLDVRTTAGIMIDNDISSLLVVSEGHLMGIVTKTDLCRYCSERCRGFSKVKDFMNPNVVYVKPMHSVFRALNLMVKNNISRVLVMNDARVPVGILTLTDLTLLTSSLRPVKHPTFEKLPSTLIVTAEDVMTKNPITIREDEDLAVASELMIKNGISGLPVVDSEGLLVGIITKSDVVRAVACFKEL